MFKQTLRKIENVIIDYFDGDQITISTNENLVSMEIISDSEKDKIINVRIDTHANSVFIGVTHKVIDTPINIYTVKIVDTAVEKFDPITPEIMLPNLVGDITSIIRDMLDNQ